MKHPALLGKKLGGWGESKLTGFGEFNNR